MMKENKIKLISLACTCFTTFVLLISIISPDGMKESGLDFFIFLLSSIKVELFFLCLMLFIIFVFRKFRFKYLFFNEIDKRLVSPIVRLFYFLMSILLVAYFVLLCFFVGQEFYYYARAKYYYYDNLIYNDYESQEIKRAFNLQKKGEYEKALYIYRSSPLSSDSIVKHNIEALEDALNYSDDLISFAQKNEADKRVSFFYRVESLRVNPHDYVNNNAIKEVYKELLFASDVIDHTMILCKKNEYSDVSTFLEMKGWVVWDVFLISKIKENIKSNIDYALETNVCESLDKTIKLSSKEYVRNYWNLDSVDKILSRSDLVLNTLE